MAADNFAIAKAQLGSLQKRLTKDRYLLDSYNKSSATDIEKCYVKPVVFMNPQLTNVWYLPHHPVVNPNKPGKVRRVANAASMFQGISLNSCLEAGPDLLNMFGLLLRFREQPVAVSADIEGMFMQIGIKESDQNDLRFLWNTAKGIKQYQYTRLIFGAKYSPSIAIFALNQTAKDFAASDRKTAELINRSFYMDDFVHSFESIEIAQTSSLKVKTVLNKGGFKLTKLCYNTSIAMQSTK